MAPPDRLAGVVTVASRGARSPNGAVVDSAESVVLTICGQVCKMCLGTAREELMIDAEASLGIRLREFRKRRGWSLEAMGGATGVTKATVQRWENGTAKPSVVQARRLQDLGLGPLTEEDTNLRSIPMLRQRLAAGGVEPRVPVQKEAKGRGYRAQGSPVLRIPRRDRAGCPGPAQQVGQGLPEPYRESG